MNRNKVEKIFSLLERMSDDIDSWMRSAKEEGWNVSGFGIAASRDLLEEAGSILQEWKAE